MYDQFTRHGDERCPLSGALTMAGLFDLTGKRALITGSSQGIGLALARGLAEAGAALVLNGRDKARLETAAATRCGPMARSHAALDVTDHDAARTAVDGFEVDRAASTSSSTMPACSIAPRLRIFRQTPSAAVADEYRQHLQRGAGLRAAHDRARGPARSSISPACKRLARVSSRPIRRPKGAVANLTKGHGDRLGARYGLNCNALAPGYFDTPLNAGTGRRPDFSALAGKRTPPVAGAGRGTGRRGGVPVGAGLVLRERHRDYVDGGITASLWKNKGTLRPRIIAIGPYSDTDAAALRAGFRRCCPVLPPSPTCPRIQRRRSGRRLHGA